MTTQIRTKDTISPVFMLITVISVSALLIANILANRMVQVGPWVMDAGALTFPITYIISDIVSEVYGYRWSRRISWLSAGVNMSAVLLIALAMRLPLPEFVEVNHFTFALANSFRIVIASLVSFVLGDWVDDLIFEKLRQQKTNHFKVRAIISSVGGALVDTTVFCLIAFLSVIPSKEIIPMIILGVAGKIIYEILILPITGKVLEVVKKHEIAHQEKMVR